MKTGGGKGGGDEQCDKVATRLRRDAMRCDGCCLGTDSECC